jgi:hypothetical protein
MTPAASLVLGLWCVCLAAMFATGFVSDWLDRLAARRDEPMTPDDLAASIRTLERDLGIGDDA